MVILQTAFIGDVVFASPLVHAIKQAYPQCEVSLLVRPYSQDLVKCIPGASSAVTFDKYGADSGPVGVLRAARRIRNGKFDLLVSPHRSARSALVARLSGVPLRVGHRTRLGKLAYHVAVPPVPDEPCKLIQDLHLLEAIGIPSAGTRLRMIRPADKGAYLETFYATKGIREEDKLVALCIGAYWPTKRWPPVYFASLAESLKERGYLPVLFGGPSELTIESAIGETRKEPLVSCVGNTLSESAALLARCEMAVGGDSGMTHMARALGLPTVLIYGPTAQRAHCFEDNNRVLTANVKCRPCHRHGPKRCPDRHHDCMRMVSPENVMNALREITNLHTPLPQPEKNAGSFHPDVPPLAG